MPAPSTWFITHIGQDEVLQVLLVCAFYSAPTCFLLLALFISAHSKITRPGQEHHVFGDCGWRPKVRFWRYFSVGRWRQQLFGHIGSRSGRINQLHYHIRLRQAVHCNSLLSECSLSGLRSLPGKSSSKPNRLIMRLANNQCTGTW